MAAMHHRYVNTNGIRMHIVEQGEGPLVLLCHGFPELWYSWRHQIPGLAQAGYHVVAPDQRGYGRTDRPEAIEAYHILELTADIVGLVDALGERRATIIGHDWGAPVAWHCAQLRPDIFRAVALLSVPYFRPAWTDIRPTDAMKLLAGKDQFYMVYFQTPGIAEKELEADVDQTMRRLLYSASGDAPPEKRWRYVFGASETFLDSTPGSPETLPSWLTEQDLATFTQEFRRTGFRGGLNWYRNFDRMWELTRFLSGAKVSQPSLYMVGELDAVLTTWGAHVDALEVTMPNLREKVVVPGAGHWIQQERPAVVNERLIEFLAWVHDADSDPLLPPKGHS